MKKNDRDTIEFWFLFYVRYTEEVVRKVLDEEKSESGCSLIQINKDSWEFTLTSISINWEISVNEDACW